MTPTWSEAPAGASVGTVHPAVVARRQAPRAETGPEVRPFEGMAREWDAFVGSSADATYCHLACWRRIMEDVLGHRTHYLAARDRDGRLAGVLPLVEVKSRLTGHHLLSMPFLNYGGPLGSPDAQARLVAAAEARAVELGVDVMELRTRHRVGSSLTASARKINVVLDLPERAETLFEERFRSKLRAQIRRPIKEGMEVRFGREEIEPFYEVFARNMRDLGTPVLPRRYFEAVADGLGARAVFAAVWWKGAPVAGSYGALSGDEFEMVRASSLREHNKEAPNMLLYWACMSEMIDRGVLRFSFGRCTPGSGTHRFKSQWGGREVPLPWLAWSRNGGAALPSTERPLLRLASRAWSRLPVPVANVVGPFFARRLP